MAATLLNVCNGLGFSPKSDLYTGCGCKWVFFLFCPLFFFRIHDPDIECALKFERNLKFCTTWEKEKSRFYKNKNSRVAVSNERNSSQNRQWRHKSGIFDVSTHDSTFGPVRQWLLSSSDNGWEMGYSFLISIFICSAYTLNFRCTLISIFFFIKKGIVFVL